MTLNSSNVQQTQIPYMFTFYLKKQNNHCTCFNQNLLRLLIIIFLGVGSCFRHVTELWSIYNITEMADPD